MRTYGRASVSGFLGDMVVYRNLVPCDPRLPKLADIRAHVGVGERVTPRKSEPAYGRVIAHLLHHARAIGAPGTELERLVYVGDTQLNDGTAFSNICVAGNWPGWAFIGADRDAPPRVEIASREGGELYVSNRWRAIDDFVAHLRAKSFAVDERTAVIVDLDKTALGARGRNDHVIDGARVAAVRQTVEKLLGPAFDPARFREAYDELNQPDYHAFTADNQDYLAYICLILGSGLVDLPSVVADVRAGSLTSFSQFLSQVDGQADELAGELRPIHDQIAELVEAGDPTPFKDFRYNEYFATIDRMGIADDGATVSDMLSREIVLTQEVREVAMAWKAAGALLFGLSDKPDEASVPSAELVAQGYVAIHRAETHSIGSS
jgi:hypothetical protein